VARSARPPRARPRARAEQRRVQESRARVPLHKLAGLALEQFRAEQAAPPPFALVLTGRVSSLFPY